MSEIDETEPSEKDEKPFINGDRPYTPQPERPGCISAYLILGLIINILCGLFYMIVISGTIRIPKLTPDVLLPFVLICGFNVYFCFKLLSYKKSGFYGLVICTLIAYVINLLAGISPIASTLGLGGIPLLYAILQVRKNGIPFWKRLK
jgi:hypothetical protein